MTIAIQNIAQIAHYQGEGAIPGIRFRAARSAMGVTAWGMNVLELDPGCEGYPEHDHAGDQQEELYLVFDGSAALIAEGRERPVVRGDMIRVPPGVKRKFVTGDEGVTLVALGGTPGAAYGV
jgi:uncharacterized cupin superfamily protein